MNQVHGSHSITVNEQELINGCIRRERSAQKNLYDTFSPKMYALCCRYVKNPMDAEDVLVTSFTNILNRMEQFRSEGSLEGWIKRAVINECLSFLRKKKNMFMTADINEADMELCTQNSNDPLVTKELFNMIEELPPGYRIVFNMYAIDGYAHKEIAEQLNISENTSKSQLSRARVYLQKLLAQRELSTNRIQHDTTT